MRVSDEFFPKINTRSGGTIYGWTLGFYLSAHQVARKFGHEEILKLLFDRSPAPVQLIAACWVGDEAMVEALRGEASRHRRRVYRIRSSPGRPRSAQERDGGVSA